MNIPAINSGYQIWSPELEENNDESIEKTDCVATKVFANGWPRTYSTEWPRTYSSEWPRTYSQEWPRTYNKEWPRTYGAFLSTPPTT